MGLGLSVRITLALNQRRIHMALYGSTRYLDRLYPRPFLIIGDPSEGYLKSLDYYRFPVSRYCVPWKDLTKEKQDELCRAAATGEFSGVHIEISVSSWLRSHRPELKDASSPMGKLLLNSGGEVSSRLAVENSRLEGALDVLEWVILNRGAGSLSHRSNSLVFTAPSVTSLWKKYEMRLAQAAMCRHGGECGHDISILTTVEDMRMLNTRCSCEEKVRSFRRVPAGPPTGFNRAWGKIILS